MTSALQVAFASRSADARAHMTGLRRWLSVAPLLLFILLLSSPGVRAAAEDDLSAQPPTRLAIVIGNTDYASARIPDLANARNDAEGLTQSLRRLNFDVLSGVDLTADGFEKLFQEADKKMPTVSAVMLFYSGHGLQLQGRNYLLPVDTPDPDSLANVTSRAIKLDDVIARFSSRNRQTFIFLDACRNSPLGDAANMPDGLAQVEVGENTFIAFATQPGNIAVDGTGTNSPFSTALMKNVEIPGLSISDMMIRVRNETETLTFGRQVPWDQSNLREQFYFTEQQELDPAQLSASLSRILSDPAAKQKLQVELASNDLQTAVVIVDQNLRSVNMSAEPNAPPKPGGTQLASLPSTEGARQNAVSGIESLIASLEGQEEERAELARKVQTELRRLGCYRMTVDGDWGKGSIRALTDYYKNTKQAVANTEPTVELLSNLFLRSGRICKQPVIVKKVKSSSRVASGVDSGAAKVGKGKKASSKRAGATSKPAAPPPDISGGIGIGGVF
jgi:hypothetical protein